MLVLVAGAAGFTGRTVVHRLLRDGYAVIGVDRRRWAEAPVTVEDVDIRTGDMHALLEYYQPQVVVHLALSPSGHPKDNVVGMVQVLDGCAAAGVRRVIFASTAGVLYGAEAERPTPETAAVQPTTTQGVSQMAAEAYLTQWARDEDRSAVILRLATVYGAGQSVRSGAVIPEFLRCLVRGTPATIHGDGEQTRDFVHVGDVAHAVRRCIDRGTGVVNIGSGQGVTIRWVAAQLGLSVIHAAARADDVRHQQVSIRRAAHLLGWRPEIALDQGLQELREQAEQAVRRVRGPITPRPVPDFWWAAS